MRKSIDLYNAIVHGVGIGIRKIFTKEGWLKASLQRKCREICVSKKQKIKLRLAVSAVVAVNEIKIIWIVDFNLFDFIYFVGVKLQGVS